MVASPAHCAAAGHSRGHAPHSMGRGFSAAVRAAVATHQAFGWFPFGWSGGRARPRPGLDAALGGRPPWFYPVGAAMAAAILAFDLMLPLGVAGGVPYVALVLLALASPHRGDALVLAAVGTALTFFGYFLSAPLGISWMVATNRMLALFVIWVTAIGVFRHLRVEAALRRANAELKAHHAEREQALSGEIAKQREVDKALRKAAEKSRLADRAKTEFLANMSHELRTPLNSILGFSQVLAAETFGPLGSGKNREYIDTIIGSGKHLLRLINNILDVSRIEAGEITLEDDTVDVGQAMNSCMTMFKGRAAKKQVSLTVQVPAGFPALRADRTRVKQVILNLLSNAVKFTPAGGQVDVAAFLDERRAVVIRVRDTGIGIPAEDIAKVVDPFKQVADAHTRQHEGAGLGLFLAKSLTELHGGTLGIESEVGKGTAVTQRFPPERTIHPS